MFRFTLRQHRITRLLHKADKYQCYTFMEHEIQREYIKNLTEGCIQQKEERTELTKTISFSTDSKEQEIKSAYSTSPSCEELANNIALCTT